LSIITGANGNISLSPNGTGIVTTSGAFTAAGNIIGGNMSTSGTITVSGPSSFKIPGGTAGDLLSTDGNGNISWLNIGATTIITSNPGGTFANAGYSVSANSTIVLPWDFQQNEIGLVLSNSGLTERAVLSNPSNRTYVLGVSWQIVWNLPTNPTGSRRAALRENSNNKDVQIAGPVAGQPTIVQSSTTIVTLTPGSGGIDWILENYGSDQCGVGGRVNPVGDYYIPPSNRATIVLLAVH
jgi:hypothetical protein